MRISDWSSDVCSSDLIRLDPQKVDVKAFPFNTVSYLTADFELGFDAAVTILVGENGTGKSTLIEAIAQAAGFSSQGGSQDHRTGGPDTGNAKIGRASCRERVCQSV